MIGIAGACRWAMVLFAGLCLSGPAAAQVTPVVHVDWRSEAPFPDGASWATAVSTIRQGIRRAELLGGGEVWVAAGEYSEVIALFEGVDVYGGFLGSERARDERDYKRNITVLDGATANSGRPAPTIVFGANGSTLDGFVVRGGEGEYGAGMLNDNASPTVRNCQFVNNAVLGSGGAILNNPGSFPLIERCEFLGNFAGLSGGAIANNEAVPDIRDCLFWGNATDGAGGAIANTPGSPARIERCTFRQNNAVSGGAIHNQEASAVIAACVFEDNDATAFGGAVFNDAADPSYVNCLFTGNRGEQYGGAMANLDAAAHIMNCTFAGNSAGQFGGAVFNSASNFQATNTIFWDNAPEDVARVSGTVRLRYSLVRGGFSGTGNLSADPRFRAPEAGDYSLAPDSPCIDRGTGQGAPEVDIEGVARPQGARVDMGAFEATEIGVPVLPGCEVRFVKNGAGRPQHGNAVLLAGVAVFLARPRRRR